MIHNVKTASNKVDKHNTHFRSEATRNAKMCRPSVSLCRPYTTGTTTTTGVGNAVTMRLLSASIKGGSTSQPQIHAAPRAAAPDLYYCCSVLGPPWSLADEVARIARASAGAPAADGMASQVRGGSTSPAHGESGLRWGQQLCDAWRGAGRKEEEERTCATACRMHRRGSVRPEGEEQGRPWASTGWGDLHSPVLLCWRGINFGWLRFYYA